jgi:DNA-binding transcriptional MerR regulator
VSVTVATARRILRGQGMPPKEIRAVLAGDDPLFVRRLLELHRERLGEWLDEQQRLVASIERSLAGEPGPVRFEDMSELAARSDAGARPHSCPGWENGKPGSVDVRRFR